MYFVGIDISKFKHDCAVIDELGDVVTPSWSFSNDCGGFSLLKELLANLDSDIKIGFESTGHYGQNLKLFLESNSFTFMHICSSHFDGVDKSAARIHSSVTFHAESPFVALFRLVHFGVTRFLRILRGTGRVDDGRVHNRSTPHQIAALFNDIVDGPEQLRSEFRFFHHAAA